MAWASGSSRAARQVAGPGESLSCVISGAVASMLLFGVKEERKD